MPSRRGRRVKPSEYSSVLSSFPESFEVHQYLGRARAARGAHDEALRAFETAHRLSPRTAMIDFDAARSLAAQRKFGAALARVSRSRARAGDVLRLCHPRSGSARRRQRDDAIAAFQKALALSPGLAVAEYELGALAEAGGDCDDAQPLSARAGGDAGMSEARAALTGVEKRESA